MPVYLSPEHLEIALVLQRKFWTQDRIARELGVRRESVSRSLSRHNRRAMALLELRTAGIKAKQVDQLEWLGSEAVEAWERSKRDAETVKTTTGGGDGAADTRTETTLKGQVGDPAFIQAARATLTDIRGILGLDAPEKFPADGPAKLAKALDEILRPEAPGDPPDPPGKPPPAGR